MENKVIFIFSHVNLTCTVQITREKHHSFGGEADSGLDSWLRKTKEWYCN